MRRRRSLSLTGQLLVLQLAVVVVVVTGVVLVTLARETARFSEVEGDRARAVAESFAGSRVARDGVAVEDQRAALDALAEGARAASGSTYVVVVDAAGTVLSSTYAEQVGTPYALEDSPVLPAGRGWSGRIEEGSTSAVVAHAPLLADDETVAIRGGRVGDVIGAVVVGREAPTVLGTLRQAAPTLLTYLGIATLVGVLGSVLVARRVRRQTLGLDPHEIVGLVEHRDAVLHAIREGIVAVDLRGRVTIVNDEALALLGLTEAAVGQPLGALGLDPDLVEALTQPSEQRDQVFPVEGRLLILNSLPVTKQGVRIGSVTTLRDRTELMALQRELDVTQHATDTLRAQAHEFSNRLHTISGLIELEEFSEVVSYVQRLDAGVSRFTDEVVERIADPAVAALLVAKGAQADERGVRLAVEPTTRMSRVDEALSTDVTTVVGNLVDNALDAVQELPGAAEPVVRVEVVASDGLVRVTVRDNGPGVDPAAADELFRRGFSTKPARVDTAGQRGIGLSLVRLVCRRRGGGVEVHNDGGAVFVATLPHRAPEGRPTSVADGAADGRPERPPQRDRVPAP